MDEEKKTSKNARVWLIVLAVLIIGIVILIVWKNRSQQEPAIEITSFKECIEAGYPAMESYPRQCRTDDDKTFTEDIGNELEKTDMIRVNTPRPNQVVESPLTIEGEARGTWFFEGDFPVRLLDEQGREVAVGIAQTKQNWMTEDFVSFKAELEFSAENSKRGNLILQKDNPSDRPELDDELRIPVKF